ncbi:uncharacterized protein K452DRAFT_236852 [Aplosporella prunicola CBS 121167]|uniref:GED domain-containing protein n=1 Tax=Aplosporella prunicola CBS 121167 TaxID=1176127 RepID=A0A6A6AZW8_9PEZI|nr:uncharacterized protein K452DRAFT_236852 [Aplosporella prunicola CBS 121167]KAF2136818.1 hypothetical protein K452DRAFT_236852 [Aplosporella prunicola CBS 121167]
MASSSPTLADPTMLAKIDRLSACNVGHHINLPQIVVVGDQSSGKSSALEGLTNLPFPRDSGLCTRFATQITFRRSAQASVAVSIIPSKSADAAHAERVRTWRKDLPVLEQMEFANIMREVCGVMGLSVKVEASDECKTFSEDVLWIEVSGPEQEHLSVIDVPGIFKRTTQGIMTKADIQLVEEMVYGYMRNPRSVMLAVIPANVDIATQAILEMAEEVDPKGERTLGVLTKPDLMDKGAEKTVVDMIEGRNHKLTLGWCLVRNPGKSEYEDSNVDRNAIEKRFFASVVPWNTLSKDRVGTESLRMRLQEILATHIRREFPKVRAEVSKKLKECKAMLKDLGIRRDTAAEQSKYLIDIATQFQSITDLALGAQYHRNDAFEEDPSLTIATAVVSRNDFMTEPSEKKEDEEKTKDKDKKVNTRTTTNHDELDDIQHDNEQLFKPYEDGILYWLKEIYLATRGFEMGTFDPSLLPMAMKSQTKKWDALAHGYISDIVNTTHTFITNLLQRVCPDPTIRANLMSVLTDELTTRYTMAIAQVDFILNVERAGIPMTLNRHFAENLDWSRRERTEQAVSALAFNVENHGRIVELLDLLDNHHHSLSNSEQIVRDLHDILYSYYQVAQKRIVDAICMQAAEYHLICGPETPLKLFSPLFVGGLSADQLEEIAGEDALVKRKRAQLMKEIEDLEMGRKILT